MKHDPEDASYTDEINREDGLERYWLFYNGEWAETISALMAASGGVLWCFLWILGYSQTFVAYGSGVISLAGFCGWYLFLSVISRYEQEGWGKKLRGSPDSERKKIFIAVGLWVFIILFFGAMVLSQGRPHR